MIHQKEKEGLIEEKWGKSGQVNYNMCALFLGINNNKSAFYLSMELFFSAIGEIDNKRFNLQWNKSIYRNIIKTREKTNQKHRKTRPPRCPVLQTRGCGFKSCYHSKRGEGKKSEGMEREHLPLFISDLLAFFETPRTE